MGILSDWQIRARCEGSNMIEPFDLALLNPASIDVRLGPNLLVEVEHTSELQPLSIQHSTASMPYWLAPGEFVLAETIETFNLPSDIAGQFMLKSSRAREGLEHLMAGYCDPGWHGSKLTLELHNSRRLHSLPIWHGMKIGQLVLHKMDELPLRSYALTGRYNQDSSVQGSRG
jgi:dCTP deaminase